MSTTDGLADFLRARLDEREAKARADLASAWAGHMLGLVGWHDAPANIYDAAQAHAILAAQDTIADVEAKRRIVEDIVENDYVTGEGSSMVTDGLAVRVLQAFAEPYAAHPDYRDEWRP